MICLFYLLSSIYYFILFYLILFYFILLYFILFIFDFLFYLGVHSGVITCSPIKAQGWNVPNSLTVRMGFHCSFVSSGT